MSAMLWAFSWIAAAIGPFWGVYVGRMHRKWKMAEDIGLALAIAPPFLISIALGAASVFTK